MSALFKMRGRGVAKMDGAHQVHVDLAAPFVRRRVLERLSDREPGVVHQDVEASEVGNDALDHGLHRGAIRDVGLISLRLAALLVNVRDDGFGFIGRAAMVDRDCRAFRGERQSDLAPDVTGASGDQSNAFLSCISMGAPSKVTEIYRLPRPDPIPLG